jgi:hypothetical protein
MNCNCDVENCKNKSVVMVDDHGVDARLCIQHYQDWIISEITTLLKLTDALP